MIFLGIDLGSSSVKGSLFNLASGKALDSAQYPEEEMAINSPEKGWAEQDPDFWWECVKNVIRSLSGNGLTIAGIGISYQMHGLVAIDETGKPVRPSIIWCDSRAVATGSRIIQKVGVDYANECLLNQPGNFTASKLRWVKEHEPTAFDNIKKVMLPGDYIAYKLSGQVTTTASGLSEGIWWDFKKNKTSEEMLEASGIGADKIPELVPSIGLQTTISEDAAKETGLTAGTPIAYRAGDQPNNAFSLNVLEPGEIAATAGTSGVIYAVTDQLIGDSKSRINTFLHVNNSSENMRNGLLLCINGTGIMNSWLRRYVGQSTISYQEMNMLASQIEPGSEGLKIFPFGNGAERVLENQNPGAFIDDIDLNRHKTAHILRAGQEGIVFALQYGFELLKTLGLNTNVIRAGKANMFLSSVFREIFVNTTGVNLELYDTDGSIGAARGAAMGVTGKKAADIFSGLVCLEKMEPKKETVKTYQRIYSEWKNILEHKFIIK